ncbi:DUF1800 family protein [Paludibaculum fermentans]|uniref:DUF1800 family protein n=1 Tax=Paludibaculum fermentans TaxID=1473598 RepID=A0A7S7SLP7_PALFE|nr:DUF1800 family protein [Paludibaculum fermentans]QOY89063.1 DUF1800 family protein [Paludibaculum fermentans]
MGTTRTLTAYVPLSPATIKWSINGVVGGNSTYGTITATGVYTAPAVPPAANLITVAATSTAYPAIVGSAQLTITYAQPYIWSSSPSKFAAGPVSLTLNGAAFMPGTTATINNQPMTATYFSPTKLVVTGNVPVSMVGTVQLRVSQPAPGAVTSDPLNLTVTLSSVTVSVSPSSASVGLNATQTFTATVGGTANTAVTWSATAGTISSSGVYTAPSSLPNPAVATVKATSVADPLVSASASITLTQPVTSVTVSPSSASVQTGATRQFTATVANNANQMVTWTVNNIAGGNSTVGTISSTGLYTAPAVVPSPAAVTVKASSVAVPAATASATVTVTVPATSVTLTPSSASVQSGTTRQFTAVVNNNANQAVTWTVNNVAGGNATVGTISTAGLYTAPANVPNPSAVTVKATSVAVTTASASATVTITVVVPPVNLTTARFLEQAAFGPSAVDSQAVSTLGINAWLAQQLSLPETTIPVTGDVNQDRSQFLWRMVHAPDQLRQRMINALAKIIVLSTNKNIYSNEIAPYWQILSRNAFGNYRQLLWDITVSPQMGKYLDLANSTKPGVGGGANENYPREIMQLFSIGLMQLNLDGSTKLDGQGNPIPTYDQATVSQTARALTGWTYPTAPGAQPQATNWENFSAASMETREQNHDTTAKTLVGGCAIPAGLTVTAETNAALDCIFQHPNVGPFVATRLIRDMVTSNPSPAYIQRVAQVFNDNGAGVRGDLKAVVLAILTDSEARQDVATPTQGRLKDPHFQFAEFVRSLNGSVSQTNTFSYMFVDQSMSPLGPPSVFGFYPMLYRIPKSPLFGPEFQIYGPTESLVRANFFFFILTGQMGSEVTVNLTPFQNAASDIPTLIETVNNTLLYGRMPQSMKTSLATAIAAMPDNNQRVLTALYLTALSGQFAVQY